MSLSVLSIKNPGILHHQRQTAFAFDYNNVLDTSGNAKHLTLGGHEIPTIATDAFGSGLNGLTFNGKNNIVCEGVKYDINTVSGDYSFEFRFKRDTANNGVMQVLFGRFTDASPLYYCYFDTDNKLKYFHNVSGGTNVAASANAITDGNAHSVAICKTGIFMYMFIDGVQAALVAVGTALANDNSCPFRIGAFDYGTVFSPFFGTIGDFRFSNNARHTSGYTPTSSYLTVDANTIAYLKMDALHGNALDAPVFQSNILLRSGHAQASGGWANPDGFLRTADNKYFFEVCGYNGLIWSVYAAISNTLYGTYTLQSNPIQLPTSGEDIAGNGTVIYFNGQYFHYFHDNPLSGGVINLRYSTGSDLNAAFSTPGTILFTGGVGGYKFYVDPQVRATDTGLEMFFVGQDAGNARWMLHSTSTDGITWSAFTVLGNMLMPYHPNFLGEVCFFRASNCILLLGDGAPSSVSPRSIMRWISKDGSTLLPLLKYYTTVESGYQAVYDASLTYDSDNNRMILIATHSTNTQGTQPTDSDIGMWFCNIITY